MTGNPVGHKDDFHSIGTLGKGSVIVMGVKSSSSAHSGLVFWIFLGLGISGPTTKEQTDLKANLIFATNLLSDPKQVPLPHRACVTTYKI